jgi:hypothetical protein
VFEIVKLSDMFVRIVDGWRRNFHAEILHCIQGEIGERAKRVAACGAVRLSPSRQVIAEFRNIGRVDARCRVLL